MDLKKHANNAISSDLARNTVLQKTSVAAKRNFVFHNTSEIASRLTSINHTGSVKTACFKCKIYDNHIFNILNPGVNYFYRMLI